MAYPHICCVQYSALPCSRSHPAAVLLPVPRCLSHFVDRRICLHGGCDCTCLERGEQRRFHYSFRCDCLVSFHLIRDSSKQSHYLFQCVVSLFSRGWSVVVSALSGLFIGKSLRHCI